MDFLPWLFVAILAALAGTCLVQYLVSSPLRMSFYLLLIMLLIAGIAVLGVIFFTDKKVFLAFILILVCFVGGYLSATGIFLTRREKRDLPAITRQAGEKGKGHTAVIYFTHGEPPGYSPLPWLETMREFDQDKVTFIPFLFRPFFFYALRKEYLKIGGSPHNKIHEYLFRAVQASFSEEEKSRLRFYLAYLDSNPRPDEMAIHAINDGADRIILLPVFITVSSHTLAGLRMVVAHQPNKYGVSFSMAEPLWNSEQLRQYFLERTNAVRGASGQEKIGVLLVGHGQPKAWDAIYPTQTLHENLYRQGIKELLVINGYNSENVLLAWMSFQNPSIGVGLRKLVTNGVDKILVFSVSISAASLHSEVDVPEACRKAHIPKNTEVINMGAFGDPFDQLVVGAIREKILACR